MEDNGADEEREKKEELDNGMPEGEFEQMSDNNKINPDKQCPEGYVWVKPYKNFYGVYTKGYCRKGKKRHML